MTPTTIFPEVTKFPKASMTWPALPVDRINRVEATLRPSLNKVITRSIPGKTEKSRTLFTYIETIRIIKARDIMPAKKISSKSGGKGIIMMTMTPITTKVMPRSLLAKIRDFDFPKLAILNAELVDTVSPADFKLELQELCQFKAQSFFYQLLQLFLEEPHPQIFFWKK